MPPSLFEQIIFGPVKSRRLGNSLGINLLALDVKYCTFNCIYCECGWTNEINPNQVIFPERAIVKELLEKKIKELLEEKFHLDVITFAGNGEPTTHPEFANIVKDVIEIKNKYIPHAKLSLLSNATMLGKDDICEAINNIDNKILKLDAGSEKMYQLINKATNGITLQEIVENLKKVKSNLIIQTLFLKGSVDGVFIDNTTEEEVNLWLQHIESIKPSKVMLYPIDRETPAVDLFKVSKEELEKIASKVRKLGIEALVY